MAADMEPNNLLLHLHKWASRQDENFLTDAFAHLLRHLRDKEPEIAARILGKLTEDRLPLTAEEVADFEITTQVATDLGRPDLEIRGLDQLVYVEAKVESGLGERQLARYREELQRSGVPNTTLVLLTRYPPDIPTDDELPDVPHRWYEVADWLVGELELETIRDPVSVFLTKQFVDFLTMRNITMEKVAWDLPGGVRSCRSLVAMLGEAVASRKLKCDRSGAWGWIGYYMDNKKFFLGLYYDRPETVVFESNELPVSQEAAERAGFGAVIPGSYQPGGIKWVHELNLESEEVHFFARSRQQQMQCIEEFLDKSLAAESQIAASPAK